MKETRRVLTVLFLTATLALASFTGCKTGHGRWDPATATYSTELPGDPIVVNAQKVRATALNLMATYFKIEKENRAKLWKASHDFKHIADDMRRTGESSINLLTNAIDAYQRARTPENKVSIEKAIGIITRISTDLEQIIAHAKAVK